jgi:hypothetical protein
MMMTANLVGFCVGVDGMKDILPKIFNLEGKGPGARIAGGNKRPTTRFKLPIILV